MEHCDKARSRQKKVSEEKVGDYRLDVLRETNKGLLINETKLQYVHIILYYFT